MPKFMPRHVGKHIYSKSLWEPFEQYLKGNGDFEKCPKSIGDPLSNASRVTDTLWEMLKIKVETRLVHFPSRPQPIGNKETPSVYHSLCLRICKEFSVYFLEAWWFY
jgi:hypothetical protein